MVENEEITGSMRGDGEGDLVSDFIGTLNFLGITFWTFLTQISVCLPVYCKANYVVVT